MVNGTVKRRMDVKVGQIYATYRRIGKTTSGIKPFPVRVITKYNPSGGKYNILVQFFKKDKMGKTKIRVNYTQLLYLDDTARILYGQ